MMIAAVEPGPANSAVKAGFVLPRHTVLRSRLTEGEKTPCEFRTAAEITLWPIEITEAEYIESRGELVAAGVASGTNARAGIRLRLKRRDGDKIADLPLQDLNIHLRGGSANNWALLELICTQTCALAARSTDRRSDWSLQMPEAKVVHRGFERDEALLPTPRRSLDGYRLLQEYFAMPERFLFIDLKGIGPALERAEGDEVDIYILLKDGERDLRQVVVPEAFTLHAVPAINLFPKRCDRVQLSPRDTEHHVIPSRTAALDFEIHSIQKVAGISSTGDDDVDFRPFYSSTDFTAAGEVHPAYYTIRRRMRERSEKERLRGVRTSYLGSEVYLSLVDRTQAPYGPNLEQIAVQALCSNRDLPMLLSTGDTDVFQLTEGGPVKTVRLPVSPTRPHPTLAQGDTAWRLISHLSLNYLSLVETGKGNSAEALRELVGLYAPLGDRVTEKQLEGINTISCRPIVRRMSDEVLSTAVRGLEISIGFDESFFEGTSVFVLGAVLERFMRKYASINSFTETVLTTQKRGEIARWRPEKGLGQVL